MTLESYIQRETGLPVEMKGLVGTAIAMVIIATSWIFAYVVYGLVIGGYAGYKQWQRKKTFLALLSFLLCFLFWPIAAYLIVLRWEKDANENRIT
jgi:hypothetical protein